jgi:hypothetical protein
VGEGEGGEEGEDGMEMHGVEVENRDVS